MKPGQIVENKIDLSGVATEVCHICGKDYCICAYYPELEVPNYKQKRRNEMNDKMTELEQVKYEMDWEMLLSDMEFDKVFSVMRGMNMTMDIPAPTGKVNKVPETIHEVISAAGVFIHESLELINNDPLMLVSPDDEWIVFESHPFVFVVNLASRQKQNMSFYFAPLGISGTIKKKVTIEGEL